eukprot:2901881-Alexandrium_andersonii.AAC.1
MLLELQIDELSLLLRSDGLLRQKVAEALQVLDHADTESMEGSAYEESEVPDLESVDSWSVHDAAFVEH